MLVGGVFITYFLGKKIINGIQKSSTQDAADDSPSVRQAILLRSAMNRSGVALFKSSDGTNEGQILDTAFTITNLDEVRLSYKNLYQDNLLDDLQSELSADDYQKFLTLVSSNKDKKGSKSPIQFASAGNLIVAKKEVVLRSSPDASNHGAVYEVLSKNTMLRTATPGEFLGYATGKQSFDVKNNVKFIEVGFVINGSKAPTNLKSQNKKKTLFWVSSSASFVEEFTSYKSMFELYPDTQRLTPWMKPLHFFDAVLKGIPLPRLLTTSIASVLDEQFQVIAIVQPNTLLGKMTQWIDTNTNERFYKFTSVDNTQRWVNAKNIILQTQ